MCPTTSEACASNICAPPTTNAKLGWDCIGQRALWQDGIATADGITLGTRRKTQSAWASCTCYRFLSPTQSRPFCWSCGFLLYWQLFASCRLERYAGIASTMFDLSGIGLCSIFVGGRRAAVTVLGIRREVTRWTCFVTILRGHCLPSRAWCGYMFCSSCCTGCSLWRGLVFLWPCWRWPCLLLQSLPLLASAKAEVELTALDAVTAVAAHARVAVIAVEELRQPQGWTP
mmetsp:Transcript_17046/g.36805  ORF Transcript_17046/g.36805 Transcript_17046/m.36805 type:complete len:230 (+) Transcript_17046:135-824(+)